MQFTKVMGVPEVEQQGDQKNKWRKIKRGNIF
jgi:hypothetical protein